MRPSAFFLLLPLLASCASERVLVTASDLDNPPFAALDESGVAVGRDIEMMERIATELGYELEWLQVPFTELLDVAAAGEVDVVCATLGITDERERRIDFSRPYFQTQLSVVVRAGEGEPDSLGDLAGRRVSAGAGTTSEVAVKRSLPNAIGVFENKDALTTRERLERGLVDAAVMDGPAADALVRDAGGGLRLLGGNLGAERYALVFPPQADELRARVDEVLEKLERSGALADMDRRHGVSP